MNEDKPTKYIFCVSPGRSGTHYLYHIFSCVHGVCATHEPEHEHREYARLRPQLWDLKSLRLSRTYSERKSLKLSQIADMLSRSRTNVYAETNPLFSTLWHDVILDELSGQDITVLVLRRNASEVLKSLLDLGWFNNRDGNDWMITAYSVNSLVQPTVPENEATPFDLVASYLLNVEMYAQRIIGLCREQGHKVVELSSNQLFGNDQMVHGLLTQCGLLADYERLAEVIKVKKNKARTVNKYFDVPLEICARELELYLRRYTETGEQVPESFLS